METAIPNIQSETQQPLPEGWKWRKLNELGYLSRGKSKHRPRNASLLYGGPYPFVQTGDIKDTHLILNKYHQTYSEIGLKQSKLWEEGTLCITIAANIAETAILGIKACFPDSIIGFTANKELCDTFFLKYFFDEVKKEVQHTVDKSTQDNLSQEKLEKIQIPLPPLAEQHRIAAILTKWDEGIGKLQTLIGKKKHRKQGLMQRLLTGQSRFSEFAGQAWETVRLGDVFTFLRNESHSRECLTYESTENQVYYVHYGDIHATFETSILDFSKETRIPKLKDEATLSGRMAFLRDGDLLIADASEDYKGVGECVEVKNLGDKLAVGGLHTIVARDGHNRTALGFRSYLLQHPAVAIAIRKVSNGISVYGLSKTALSNVPIYLPPLAEQRRIATVLSAADLEIDGLTQELTLMKRQKGGLMQGLLTGKISVKHLIPSHHDPR
ncbi:restriction endonuclease subunit S [uncultured Fibrella sp.]|uniref:restriction endonuclease subunit S n=1 Tax=uncultured Fibrella sp. TaxID=1284596 RepID=UPI0035CA6264